MREGGLRPKSIHEAFAFAYWQQRRTAEFYVSLATIKAAIGKGVNPEIVSRIEDFYFGGDRSKKFERTAEEALKRFEGKAIALFGEQTPEQRFYEEVDYKGVEVDESVADATMAQEMERWLSGSATR